MAITFNGVDGDVSLGSGTYLDDIFAGGGTVMGWFNADSSGENTFGRIYDKATTTASAVGWALHINNATHLRFASGRATTAGAWTSPTDSITFGQTHHVAIVYDSDDVANDPVIYIDGVSVTVTEATTPVGAHSSDAALALLAGNFSADNRTFDGWLSDMRGYDRELSSGEIQTIFTLQGVDGIRESKQWHLPMRFTGAPQGIAFSDVLTHAPAAGTSFDVPVVPNVDGQLLFLLITVTEAAAVGAVITETAGAWTEHDQQLLPTSPSRASAAIYSRAASSEPATYNFTTDLTVGFAAIMVAYDVNDNTVDVISVFNSADDAAPTNLSVSPSDEALVILTWSSDDADNNAVAPAGTDLRAFETNAAVVNDVSGGIADTQLGSGATGTFLWTGVGTEEWGCWTVAFLADLPTGEGTPDVQDIGPNTTNGIPSGALVTTADELRHTKRRAV